VLVNTNFSENAYVGQEMLRHMRTISGGIVDEHDHAWYAARHAYETAIFDEFADMLRHVGRELPDIPVIVRPHPQEDFARWRTILKEYPSITVLYEGSVHSWALAAAAVVHNSCTTGVESHLLGCPVIAYRPIRSDVYDIWLPNAVSEEITDRHALVRRLRHAVAQMEAGSNGFQYRERQALEHHFGPLEGRYSYERIMDVIESLDVPPEPFPESAFSSAVFKENMREVIRLGAQRLPRRASERVFGRAHLDYWYFDQQKFPTVTRTAFENQVRELRRVNPAFAEIQVTELGRNLFALRRDTPTPCASPS